VPLGKLKLVCVYTNNKLRFKFSSEFFYVYQTVITNNAPNMSCMIVDTNSSLIKHNYKNSFPVLLRDLGSLSLSTNQYIKEFQR
jgi:hypothetical protein